MNEKYAALRANVGMLGQLLGKSIKDHQGQTFLDKIETIRQLAMCPMSGSSPPVTCRSATYAVERLLPYPANTCSRPNPAGGGKWKRPLALRNRKRPFNL